MTVLVGYVPTAEGEAAFAAGLEEARRRGEDLVVPNSPRGGAPVSADVAAPDVVAGLAARAAAGGVAQRVRQSARDGDAADEVLRPTGWRPPARGSPDPARPSVDLRLGIDYSVLLH